MRVIILLAMLYGNSVWAASVQELKELMQTPQQLTGYFTQNKYLAAVDASLKSSGTFSYKSGTEITWHTLNPIENTLTLTPNQIISTHNGQRISIIDGQDNPVVKIFSDLFFGVMTANWALLQEYFTIDVTLSQGQWQAQLIPIDTSIAQVIIQITLSGTELLQHVELSEINGNTTTIYFSSLVSKGSH
ncbi:LolA family protein [Marinomonas posidonica]|uniref:Outer membrane lipoprotein carrier protein LolA n=1 Tax=Marinomonas posidonica (strain CECT 7376 / NCIMB 14433 / IVIA-Po-181) TaxID=491952 RepID=F6CZV1_MARPP|nr:outer membrane lipoprotein carrier protein LolA [Marinomonas posidonica]AEF53612.1 hypothetical protein Mar181_0552 [Marinomonas posidonica IVIA-Po-181]